MRRECLDIVKPEESWFDGICGGFIWLNGRPMVRELRQIPRLERPFFDETTLVEYLGMVKVRRLFK